MSMPGIGTVMALTFRSAEADPARFRSSKNAGPLVVLTLWRNQSGERDVSDGITKAGDVNLRQALRANKSETFDCLKFTLECAAIWSCICPLAG